MINSPFEIQLKSGNADNSRELKEPLNPNESYGAIIVKPSLDSSSPIPDDEVKEDLEKAGLEIVGKYKVDFSFEENRKVGETIFWNFYAKHFLETSVRLMTASWRAYLGTSTIYFVKQKNQQPSETSICDTTKTVRDKIRKNHPTSQPVRMLDLDEISKLNEQEWYEYALRAMDNKVHACDNNEEVLNLYKLLESLHYE
ncbi:hypothetical protein M0R04_01260 [Candidatus Dojkabacteria bacterium]|jgi:hypothetical protein|nr:hypothetical protein [Candidatus Dojkabacteria bacterium]